MKSARRLFLALLISYTAGCQISQTAVPVQVQAGEDARCLLIVAYCKTLTPFSGGEYRKQLTQLAQSGDFEALRAIYSSDFTFSSWAAEEMCRVLSPIDAVAFCEGFDPGSRNWIAAFRALQYHEKDAVIDYVIKMGHHANLLVRYESYELCSMRKWSELRHSAERDLDNSDDHSLAGPNRDPETISDMARRYLVALDLALIQEAGPVLSPSTPLVHP